MATIAPPRPLVRDLVPTRHPDPAPLAWRWGMTLEAIDLYLRALPSRQIAGMCSSPSTCIVTMAWCAALGYGPEQHNGSWCFSPDAPAIPTVVVRTAPCATTLVTCEAPYSALVFAHEPGVDTFIVAFDTYGVRHGALEPTVATTRRILAAVKGHLRPGGVT